MCYRGNNTQDEAVAQFDNVIACMKAGIAVYSYWNVVLSETPQSTWGWNQNSLVTANSPSDELIYNPDYDVYKLFAENSQSGAVRVMTFSSLANTLVVKNPDGGVVLFLRKREAERDTRIYLDGKERGVALPGHSLSAITL